MHSRYSVAASVFACTLGIIMRNQSARTYKRGTVQLVNRTGLPVHLSFQ